MPETQDKNDLFSEKKQMFFVVTLFNYLFVF